MKYKTMGDDDSSQQLDVKLKLLVNIIQMGFNIIKYIFQVMVWTLKLVYPLVNLIMSINIISKPIKWIIHRITGTSELQRSIISGNVDNLITTFKRSKKMQVQQYLIDSENLDIQGYHQQIEQIKKQKGLIQELNKQNEIMLWKVFNCFNHQNILRQFQARKWTGSDEQEHKLKRIWESLMDEQYQRLSEKWIDIGFQGVDPVTDFRGSGILGLENLYYFTTSQNMVAKKILATSRIQNREFFMCSAGIFVTVKMMELISKNIICRNQFAECGQKSEIYVEILIEFESWWRKQQDANMMQFNVLIIKFFQQRYGS